MAQLYKTTGETLFVGDEGNAAWLHVAPHEKANIARAILLGLDCWCDEDAGCSGDQAEEMVDKEIEDGARVMGENDLRKIVANFLGVYHDDLTADMMAAEFTAADEDREAEVSA